MSAIVEQHHAMENSSKSTNNEHSRKLTKNEEPVEKWTLRGDAFVFHFFQPGCRVHFCDVPNYDKRAWYGKFH